MPIIHDHPTWCDTENCVRRDDTLDHRSHPMAWKATNDNFWLSIGVSQFQGFPPDVPYVADLQVVLGVLDLAGLGPNGERVRLETDLTAKDARLLAAALVAAAEQVEAQQGQEAA